MFSILNSDLCFDTYHGFISLEDSLMPDNRDPWDTHDPDNFEDDVRADDWDGNYTSEDCLDCPGKSSVNCCANRNIGDLYPDEEDGLMESDLFDGMMDNDLDD